MVMQPACKRASFYSENNHFLIRPIRSERAEVTTRKTTYAYEGVNINFVVDFSIGMFFALFFTNSRLIQTSRSSVYLP
jgi:hypothetical protein